MGQSSVPVFQQRRQQALAGLHREGRLLRDPGRRRAGHDGRRPGGQSGLLRQDAAARQMLRQVPEKLRLDVSRKLLFQYSQVLNLSCFVSALSQVVRQVLLRGLLQERQERHQRRALVGRRSGAVTPVGGEEL